MTCAVARMTSRVAVGVLGVEPLGEGVVSNGVRARGRLSPFITTLDFKADAPELFLDFLFEFMGFFEHFRVTTEFDATICIGIGDYTYLDPVAGDIFKLPESKNPVFESHELTEATDTIIFILKNSGE